VSETDTSKGGGLSKISILNEFCNFRHFFLKRIYRKIFSHETAEDIFQEACLKFLVSPAVFEYPQAATKYFCLILRSLILGHLSSGRWIEYRSDLPELVCEPQRAWERDILLDRVSEAIGTLPVKDQRLLTAYFGSNQRLKDKCKALHLPNSTMRYQVGKAIAKVRKMVAG
jgi:RNA polymerase sigma factor (sigma-70 family)